MFSYIRWFAIVSFILVVLAAVFLGRSFREIASHDLIAVVENSNASLAQGFINTTWREDHDQVKAATDWYHQFHTSGLPIDQWKNYKGYQEMVGALDNFSKGVFKHFEDTPVIEVSIYMSDGARLISTNPLCIVSSQTSLSNPSCIVSAQGSSGLLSMNPAQATRSDGTFDKALSGEAASTVLVDQPFVRPDGTATKGVLIKTMIPIKDSKFVPVVAGSKNVAEAVVEIRYDVTTQWKQLDLFQQIGTFGVIGIFVVIISTLLFTSSRAESIIAKQHETNLELAAQAANAQAENRDKSQFLANISHELRTPLNAIIGFSEFIKSERSGPIANEKYGEYIKDIHSSGVHLLSLINDILDYSKAEADKLELEISEVDATKSVKNSMRLVSPRAESAQIALVEGIPREHFIIKTDAKKLKQVMLNLLSNAVKFTPSGGSVTVSMWQNVVEETLSIEVKDTGIGIAAKDISRAMAPFGQVDNTLSRKYEGTGLGLPLTRKFVEIMGGEFSIQSEVGKGTVIVVTLPKEAKGRAASPDAESNT